MLKKIKSVLIYASVGFSALAFTACTGQSGNLPETQSEVQITFAEDKATEVTAATAATAQQETTITTAASETEESAVSEMKISINGTEADVVWEDNESVRALMELVKGGELSVSMSGYGGFEQVGELGRSLPSEDTQITTEPGDIVLYSGDKIVVFYGSNTWRYTKLGHISDMTDQEIEKLLSGGDVEIKIYR